MDDSTERLEPEPPSSKRNVAKVWTRDLTAGGWTAVSNFFLENYSSLKPPLTTPEAMLVIHLLRHKWSEQPPFPRFKTLGARMGMTPTAVRNHARKLESKGYLHREVRVAKPNLFYLDGLFAALEKLRAEHLEEAALLNDKRKSRRSRG